MAAELTILVKRHVILHLLDRRPAVARTSDQHDKALIIRPCFGETVIP